MKFNFIHIPKTAGLTFYYFLEECFGKDKCFRAGGEQEVRDFHAIKDLTFFEKYKVISGHLKVDDFEEKDLLKNNLTFCFVREPLEREISSFKHYLSTPEYDRGDQRPHSSKKIDLINHYFKNYAKLTLQSGYIGSFENKDQIKDYIEKINLKVFPIHQLGSVALHIKKYANVNNFPVEIFNKSKDNILNEEESNYLIMMASEYVKNEAEIDNYLYLLSIESFQQNIKSFGDFLLKN
jgi:hypothetical protein